MPNINATDVSEPRLPSRTASGAVNAQHWNFRVTTLIAALAAILGLTATTLPGAYAATAVNVRWGTCSVEYKVPNGLGFGSGVNLNLGSHSSRYIKLYGKYSWGWNRAQNGQNLPSTWKNQYHVRFLDSRGRAVWTEYNSLPNGGSRKYYVGSNVRTIQVITGVGLDSYGRARVLAVAPAVSYDAS